MNNDFINNNSFNNINNNNINNDTNTSNIDNNSDKKKNIIKIIVITLSILIVLFVILYLFVFKSKDNNEYLSVNVISKNVNVGNSFNIIARVENNNKPNLLWSSDSNNCSVIDGKVTGVSKGTCVISVKYKDMEKKVNVYVLDPNNKDKVTEFRLVSKNSLSLLPKEVSQISISINPAYLGGSIKYSSSDNNICTVDYSGSIKAIKPGSCKITCSVDGSNDKLVVSINVTGNESDYGNEGSKPFDDDDKPKVPVVDDPKKEETPPKKDPEPEVKPVDPKEESKEETVDDKLKPLNSPKGSNFIPDPNIVYASSLEIKGNCLYDTVEEARNHPCSVIEMTYKPLNPKSGAYFGLLNCVVNFVPSTKAFDDKYINDASIDDLFEKGIHYHPNESYWWDGGRTIYNLKDSYAFPGLYVALYATYNKDTRMFTFYKKFANLSY